jgi:phosphoserine phosphatase RsbU/P
MRVLIVEDDRPTLRLLAGLAESWGHEVLLAENGQQALAAFDATVAPDLVLLDWMLPDVNGLGVCRTIRARGGPIAAHIIMLTSRSDRSDLVAGLDAGADEYLVKPVDPIELRARIRAGERMIDLQQRLAGRVLELETALASVHKLTGLLPICAYCHSIRDDTNYWHRVEEYLSEHSDATFSHGICPNCKPRVQREMALDASPEAGQP